MDGPRKRLYLLHRWTGLLLALAGMLVFFSGAIATFHEELDAWSGRGHRFASIQHLPGFDLDEAYRVAAEGLPEDQQRRVSIRQLPGHPLRFTFRAARGDEAVIRSVDPVSTSLVSSAQGRLTELQPLPKERTLARFFLDLHIFLLMPRTLGLIATGLAGFGLLVLVCTGTLVHLPRLYKLFRRPRTHKLRQLLGDLHTLVGSWTLPYTLVLALTGTFLSFAGAVLLPVIALVAFDGDQDELVRVALGTVEVADSDDVARLQPIVDDACERRPGSEFFIVNLADWRDEGANATVRLVEHSTTSETAHALVYDGHTGAFLRAKPRIGTTPSWGSTALTVTSQLHFGTLLGVVTKILWGICGLMTCFIAASGLLIYLQRHELQRHEHDSVATKGPAASRLVRIIFVALAGGLPMATAITGLAWAAACRLPGADPPSAMTVGFLATLATAAAVGAVTDLRRALVVTWSMAGFGFGAVVLSAPMATGVGVAEAWSDPSLRSTVLVDAALLVFGATCLWAAARVRKGSPAKAR
ncbi:MAG: PepSY-associated TM helix domain-containing protein [Myxococcota bacterium]